MAAAPGFVVLVGDLRTGRVFTRLNAATGSWQQAPLNEAGTMSVAVHAGDADMKLVDLYHTTAPGRAFLAFAYDSIILNAGPIWTRKYERANGKLTLGAAGLWSLLDHRKAMPALAQPVLVSPPGAAGTVQSSAGDTTYPTSSNLSLADIAKRLLQQATSHVGGSLPIVYQADQTNTPGNTRTYYGYELKPLAQAIKEITGVIGGPEIRFQPSFTSATQTAIQWTMQAGTPAQPLLAQLGADWYFDLSAPASPVVGIEYDEDASAMATRAWAYGAGSQRTLSVAQADSTSLTAVGYPLLEIDEGFADVSVQATLDGHAAQVLSTNNRPSALWKITMRDDGGRGSDLVGASPKLGSFSPGDYAQLVTGASDPFLPVGARRARIQAVEGDLTFQHTVTFFGTNAEV